MQKVSEDFMKSFNFTLIYSNKNLKSWIKIEDKRGGKGISEWHAGVLFIDIDCTDSVLVYAVFLKHFKNI